MIHSRLATGAPLAVTAMCGADLAGRSMARASLLAASGMPLEPSSALIVAVAATAATLWALHATGGWQADRAVAAAHWPRRLWRLARSSSGIS